MTYYFLWERLNKIYMEIIGRACPSVHINEFFRYLAPPSGIFTIFMLGPEERTQKEKVVLYLLVFPIGIIGFFVPILFEGYVLYVWFSSFGLTDIVTWFTLFVSVLFIVQGWIIWLEWSE